MDVWGSIFRAQWSGLEARHEIERDDGRIEVFESASNYFSVPQSEAERELLGRLEGPVLDLAAGPGSYTLYLQEKGLSVTAADYSPGALELCRARGCQNVVPMDLRAVGIEPGSFGSIIVMGNTLGAHQTPETFPAFLRTLRHAVRPGGRLLFTMIDPLDTTDESHLLYQQRNRDRALPPGLIRMRVRYEGVADEWMHLWMLTNDELQHNASEAGWSRCEERRGGPWRVRLFETAA
jgi:SAM-dependent methyltransferase